MQEFGGYNPKHDFKEYSNIAFVNGAIDEWLPGCVQETINSDLPVLTIKHGGHHQESFLPQADDDKYLKDVRAQLEGHLDKWIGRFNAQTKTLKGAMIQSFAQVTAMAP
jgi:hypothetical protein